MKRLLSAIAGAGILAMATLTSTPAQAQFNESSSEDLSLLFNDVESLEDLNYGDHSYDDFEFGENLEQLANDLPAILATIEEEQILLANPNQISELYNSYMAGSGNGYNPDGWVITKNGCSVDVGCVVPKIGVGLALQCYGQAGLDPDQVAKCLQEKNPAKYQAAITCTFGDCPAFAALPPQLVATSTCEYAKPTTLAGHLLLNSPANFEENTAQPLQVDLLFKG